MELAGHGGYENVLFVGDLFGFFFFLETTFFLFFGQKGFRPGCLSIGFPDHKVYNLKNPTTRVSDFKWFINNNNNNNKQQIGKMAKLYSCY